MLRPLLPFVVWLVSGCTRGEPSPPAAGTGESPGGRPREQRCGHRPGARERFFIAIGSADPEAPFSSKLPSGAVRDLVGCWETADGNERWRFESQGTRGLSVTREASATPGPPARDRTPRGVGYQTGSGRYAFTAAGPVHALLFQIEAKGDHLQAWSYASHRPGAGYRWTGNTLTLRACSEPPTH